MVAVDAESVGGWPPDGSVTGGACGWDVLPCGWPTSATGGWEGGAVGCTFVSEGCGVTSFLSSF